MLPVLQAVLSFFNASQSDLPGLLTVVSPSDVLPHADNGCQWNALQYRHHQDGQAIVQTPTSKNAAVEWVARYLMARTFMDVSLMLNLAVTPESDESLRDALTSRRYQRVPYQSGEAEVWYRVMVVSSSMKSETRMCQLTGY